MGKSLFPCVSGLRLAEQLGRREDEAKIRHRLGLSLWASGNLEESQHQVQHTHTHTANLLQSPHRCTGCSWTLFLTELVSASSNDVPVGGHAYVCVFRMFADLSSPSDSSLVTSSLCEANKETEFDVQGVTHSLCLGPNWFSPNEHTVCLRNPCWGFGCSAIHMTRFHSLASMNRFSNSFESLKAAVCDFCAEIIPS